MKPPESSAHLLIASVTSYLYLSTAVVDLFGQQKTVHLLALAIEGVKGTALARYHNWITSADSMAWSATARFGISNYLIAHGGLLEMP